MCALIVVLCLAFVVWLLTYLFDAMHPCGYRGMHKD